MACYAFQGDVIRETKEREAARHLRDSLNRLSGDYLLIANLTVVPKRQLSKFEQIDLIIIGTDRIFIVELKSKVDSNGYPMKIVEQNNGDWVCEDGTRIRSPKDQLIGQYQNFRRNIYELITDKNILGPSLSTNLEEWHFNDIKKFIAIYPKAHPNSDFNNYKTDADQLRGTRGGVVNIDDIPDLIRNSDYKSETFGFRFSKEHLLTVASELSLEKLFDDEIEPSSKSISDTDHSRPVEKSPSSRRRNSIISISLSLLIVGILTIYFFIDGQDKNPCSNALTISQLQTRGEALDGKRSSVKFTVSPLYDGPLSRSFFYVEASSVEPFSVRIEGSEVQLNAVRDIYQDFVGDEIVVHGIVYRTQDGSNWQINSNLEESKSAETCNT